MRVLIVLVVALSASATAQGVGPVDPYDRPAWAMTGDFVGVYELGAGLGLEKRVGRAVILRGGAGRRGGLLGSQSGPTVSAMALGVVGGRWVEVEAGAGAYAELGGESDGAMAPSGYAGLRLSVPMGRTREGETVPNDLLLRAGGTLYYRRYASGRAEWIGMPSLSLGVAF